MITFLIGLVILCVGGYFYGKFVESVFKPDDRATPALEMADGVDYVGMKKWKNMMVELLNIAGTGPVLGPIQGILFGPIAFITIPIGCVLAGAVHDYFNGMISMRNKGAQVPGMIKKYLGMKMHNIYLVIVMILMILTGVVFVYTPGDLIVADVLKMNASASSSTIWVVYAIIFSYYLIATLFPIDKIIGNIYPIFGAILIISAIGIFFGVLTGGGQYLTELSMSSMPSHPLGQKFIPVFFITVACGILSGFHGSQATLVSRTVTSEKEGRTVFYMMMIAEGFIAMCWAAGAMILINETGGSLDKVIGINLLKDGFVTTTDKADFLFNATAMVGSISRRFLGNFGGILAVIGVIILPITSGDTAFRAVRLMLAERFNISQKPHMNRIKLSLAIFVPAIVILVFAKTNSQGFNLLWRYFGFTNQLVAIFALALSTVYLIAHKKNGLLTLIPGMFYAFVVASYIFHDKIGFGIETRLGMGASNYTISYILGALCTIAYGYFTIKYAKDNANRLYELDNNSNI